MNIRILICLIASFFYSSAWAESTSYTVKVNHESVELILLETVHLQEPSADADAFAQFLAPKLMHHTRNNGFESCSQMCYSPNHGWAAHIFTTQSQIGCVIVNYCPVNHTATEHSIHSHPDYQNSLTLSKVDRLFIRAPGHRRHLSTHHQNPHLFSEADFKAGPGYMTSSAGLWHQRSKHDIRQISSTPATAP